MLQQPLPKRGQVLADEVDQQFVQSEIAPLVRPGDFDQVVAGFGKFSLHGVEPAADAQAGQVGQRQIGLAEGVDKILKPGPIERSDLDDFVSDGDLRLDGDFVLRHGDRILGCEGCPEKQN